MNRLIWYAMVAGTLAALTACGTVTHPASAAPPAASVASSGPAVAPSAPSLATAPSRPSFYVSCALGFLAGYQASGPEPFYAHGGFFPDTLAGERKAFHAESLADPGGTVVSGAKGFFENDGTRGVIVDGYQVTVAGAGAVISRKDVQLGPVFLAPGQRERFLADDPLAGTQVQPSTFYTAACTVEPDVAPAGA